MTEIQQQYTTRKKFLLPIVMPLFRQVHGMQLMQDGATAHTARSIIQQLQHQRGPVLPSPDLKTTANVGGESLS